MTSKGTVYAGGTVGGNVTAAQREQLTELACSAEELEMSNKQLHLKIKQLYGPIEACAGAETPAKSGILARITIRM